MTTIHSKEIKYNGNKFIVYSEDINENHAFHLKSGVAQTRNYDEIPLKDFLYVENHIFELEGEWK